MAWSLAGMPVLIPKKPRWDFLGPSSSRILLSSGRQDGTVKTGQVLHALTCTQKHTHTHQHTTSFYKNSKENSRVKRPSTKWGKMAWSLFPEFSSLLLLFLLITYGSQSSLCIRIIWETLKQNTTDAEAPFQDPVFIGLSFFRELPSLGSPVPQSTSWFLYAARMRTTALHTSYALYKKECLILLWTQTLILTNIK